MSTLDGGTFTFTRVARFLERIGDHAVNIGEQISYIVSGELLQDEASPGKQPAG